MKRSELGTHHKQKLVWYFDYGQRRCAYCCRQLHFHRYTDGTKVPPYVATIEHIIPKSRGGYGHFVNTLMVCNGCNSKRANQDFEKFVKKYKLPRTEWLLDRLRRSKEYHQLHDKDGKPYGNVLLSGGKR